MASIDTHLKIDGVEGESTHKDHKGEIEVLSWTWDAANASLGSGGGSGKGKAIPGNFHFTHLYDKSAPVLAKNCVAGKHFGKAVVTCRKSGDGQKPFLVVTLSELYINSVQPSGSQGGDIVHSVSCAYKKIEFAYKAQDAKGGLTGEVKMGWDVASTELT
jgi:type VI secretion system secreted protein Hcp